MEPIELNDIYKTMLELVDEVQGLRETVDELRELVINQNLSGSGYSVFDTDED